MQGLYAAMTVIGFAIPAFFTYAYTLENPDNLLFITNPAKTVELLFGSSGRAAFSADFLWVLIVFFVWVVRESRVHRIRHSWIYILLACLFGLSGPLPLFLYMRARKVE